MKKRIVHFEIGCDNIDKAAAFYRSIFDWDISSHGDSATINTGASGAIPGHLNKLSINEPQKYVTVYIETDTLEADLELIEHHGGKTLVKPVLLPDGRYFAWFEDIAGNTLGLITPKQ
jgi:hypothetical protein